MIFEHSVGSYTIVYITVAILAQEVSQSFCIPSKMWTASASLRRAAELEEAHKKVLSKMMADRAEKYRGGGREMTTFNFASSGDLLSAAEDEETYRENLAAAIARSRLDRDRTKDRDHATDKEDEETYQIDLDLAIARSLSESDEIQKFRAPGSVSLFGHPGSSGSDFPVRRLSVKECEERARKEMAFLSRKAGPSPEEKARASLQASSSRSDFGGARFLKDPNAHSSGFSSEAEIAFLNTRIEQASERFAAAKRTRDNYAFCLQQADEEMANALEALQRATEATGAYRR